MKSNIVYKIVEIDKNNNLKTLFHGIEGSRILEINKWYDADIKMVSDNGTEYLSGFHVLLTKEETEKYLSRFKNNRELKIVTCHYCGIRKKEHSPHNVYLVDRIKILSIMDI